MARKGHKATAAARLGALAAAAKVATPGIAKGVTTQAIPGNPRIPAIRSSSAAAELGAQTRTTVLSGENVVDLDARRLRLTRVERGTDPKTREPFLRVRFPQPRRDDQLVYMSWLLNIAGFAAPFAEAFILWGSNKKPRTRLGLADRLRRGLGLYTAQHKPLAALACLDTAFLTGFLKWLDSPSASAQGRLLQTNVRRRLLAAPKQLLDALVGHPTWGRDASKIVDAYPTNAYPGATSKTTPRARLEREVLEAIDQAAQSDVREIQQRLKEGRKLLLEGTARLARGDRDYSNLSVALAEMAARYPTVLPNYKRLREEVPELHAWVHASNKRGRGHGITKLGSYLYASARDLVPFVLLLAIEGAFNPDTVLSLEESGIRDVERLGAKSVSVTGSKDRASSAQTKYLDPEWVGPWLVTLRELTQRLRSLLHPEDSNRLFVFAHAWGKLRGAKPFDSKSGPSGDACWMHALNAFRKDHNLPRFTLSQLRPTLGDEIGLRHDSLIAMQALGHRSFSTTDESYLGTGTRDREGEHLNSTVHQMQRWVESHGRIDTRRTRLAPTMDKGSATPGYGCADPYDSPRPGQKKGRLCGAYGECPACPLASAANDDPMAVALYRSLRTAIMAGQELMAPQAWLARWAPILMDLHAQLTHVPTDVLEAAAQFRLRLPPVG